MSDLRTETRVDPAGAPKAPDGPFAPENFTTMLLMALVGIVGGLVSFYRKWKEGHVRAFNVLEFIGEIVVSGLCGVVSWWIFKGASVNEYLTAAGVAIVGHMGTRAIFIAERAVETMVTRRADAVSPLPTPPADVPEEPK